MQSRHGHQVFFKDQVYPSHKVDLVYGRHFQANSTSAHVDLVSITFATDGSQTSGLETAGGELEGGTV